MNLIEIYLKDNNDVRSFFCDELSEKDGILILKYGNKETRFLRSDIKYYTFEEQKNNK